MGPRSFLPLTITLLSFVLYAPTPWGSLRTQPHCPALGLAENKDKVMSASHSFPGSRGQISPGLSPLVTRGTEPDLILP